MGSCAENDSNSVLSSETIEQPETTSSLMENGDSTSRSWKKMAQISNFNILAITAVLFGLFVIAEVIGALASNSLSLLGDAAAMSVDVFTYMTNMYAERTKSKYGTIDPFTLRVLEVYIPAFSVLALLGVTGWITADAIVIIIGRSNEDSDDVDVTFLFAFAAANLVVDIISSFLFYVRRKNILMTEHLQAFALDRRCADWDKRIPLTHSTVPPASAVPNLNMISALTHVGSDTMRTISVFIAAIVASAGGQSSTLCDAWAAVIVTSTVIMAIVPLCSEIYKAAKTNTSSIQSTSPDRDQPL